jgi:hypothetical protein
VIKNDRVMKIDKRNKGGMKEGKDKSYGGYFCFLTLFSNNIDVY